VTARPGGLTLRLGPGAARDHVALMKGSLVEIAQGELDGEQAARPPLVEWVGYTVVNGRGAVIGRVADVIEAPANDVIEIEKSGGGKLLLPAIEETVESVDGAAGRVVVGDIAPYAVDDAD
jgi:ribosomal 30S subunit maturation factor RimM